MQKMYVFEHDVSLDHYKADAFIVRCFDNRFWKVWNRFIRHLNPEHIDVGSVAGGAKILASPEKEEDRDFMLREIEKSTRLHHTKKVMLFSHTHCGAYDGIEQFGGDEEKEFEFHIEEHRKAKEVIRAKFPDLEVETYFIDTKGIVKT